MGILVGVCFKYYKVELIWWDRFLIGFIVSLVITGVKLVIRYYIKLFKVDCKDNKYIQDSKCNNIDKRGNNLDNKIVKFIIKLILIFIWWLIIYLVTGFGFGIFSGIYCEGGDGVSNSGEGNKEVMDKGKEKSDDYNISIAKGMVKEAVEGVIDGISKVVPTVVGGMVGGSLGAAVVNSSKSLPPAQKALFGLGTAIAGAFGVPIASGLGTAAVKNISNSKEGASSLSGSNISSSTGDGGNVKDFIISSILEKELSPLEMILNSEILLCVLLLVHIFIIVFIGLHKLYISSGLNISTKIISKLFSKNIVEKYDKFKIKIEKIGTTYLIILTIINLLLILFYIIMLIYANIELSNNLDSFIDVHLKMKEGVILLLMKPKFK